MDHWLLDLVVGFSKQSWFLSNMSKYVSESDLLKGVPVMMVVWYFWFVPRVDWDKYRAKLLALLSTMLIAIFVARSLAAALPFRLRPKFDPSTTAFDPLTANNHLSEWSSFPSDHAVLYCSIAAGFWMISRPVAVILFLHALIVICAPRVVLGLHWPSDILGGLAIGCALAVLLMNPLTHFFAQSFFERIFLRYPAIFYPLMFFFTFQTATMYDSIRSFAGEVFNMLN